jgi:NitT/TauT family transport system permease protein
MTLAAPAGVNGSAVAPDRRKAAGSFTAGFDMRLRGLFLTLAGVALLFIVWWLAASLLAQNPQAAAFAGFAPRPALERLVQIVGSGEAWRMTEPSLARVGSGLIFAALFGIPLGILIGRSRILAQITNVPFQFLRMISPLSWMPIAVLTFPTWDGAIVFLIGIAAIWPILFATASGARRIDPAWFKVARNLGAGPYHVLTVVIVPAIAQDILTGIRLALGVAWIVLVPAEYLGVKSGLGYAINDARDTLEYDRLAAIVLMIGVIGFGLDFALQKVIERISWLRQD